MSGSLGNKEVMAKNLSYYMDKNNVSRNKLSDDLNISYTTIRDWVKAKTYPRIDKIELLANYFGIEKSDLVEERTDSYKNITTIYNQLHEERQKVVYETAEQQLEEQLLEEQNNVVNLKDHHEDSIVKNGVDTMAARFTDPEKGLPEGVTIKELKAYLEAEAKRHGFENRPD